MQHKRFDQNKVTLLLGQKGFTTAYVLLYVESINDDAYQKVDYEEVSHYDVEYEEKDPADVVLELGLHVNTDGIDCGIHYVKPSFSSRTYKKRQNCISWVIKVFIFVDP